MGADSKIEWTDSTWTPIRARTLFDGMPYDKIGWHCEHVSPGCEHCYAEGINKRLGTRIPFKPGHRRDIEIFLDEEMLVAPLRWKKPRHVFCCSMTDLFADFVKDEWIDRMFAVMALASQHQFQVLTKRSTRMLAYVGQWMGRLAEHDPMIDHPAGRKRFSRLVDWTILPNVLPNVWLGVSAEDQQRADERIPELLATPAAVRFVSLEPLLGQITLWRIDEDEGALRGPAVVNSGGVTVGTADFPPEGYDDSYPGLDWVIVGGESGPHARPMHPEWARSIRDQCQSAGVPFFYKQTGEWMPQPDWYANHHTSLPMMVWNGNRWSDDGSLKGEWMIRGGKKRAARLLDGVEHNGMPA